MADDEASILANLVGTITGAFEDHEGRMWVGNVQVTSERIMVGTILHIRLLLAELTPFQGPDGTLQ